jgi:hypothetical protein
MRQNLHKREVRKRKLLEFKEGSGRRGSSRKAAAQAIEDEE